MNSTIPIPGSPSGPSGPSRLSRPSGLTTFFALLSFLLLTSCDYKDLCYDHNHWVEVRVIFDWQQADSASTKALLAPETPGVGMTVLFYNMDSPLSEPIRYDLPGRDGGTVRLHPGTWRAIAYNYDTETILYRGMESIATLEAYTRKSSIEEGTQLSRAGMPRAPSTENEPVILEPDPLWGCYSEPFTITMDDAVHNSQLPTPNSELLTPNSLTLYPTLRVCEVTVTIHNVPNLQYTGQFAGALSGLAGSVWMESARLGDGVVTQAFTASATDDTTLQMKFHIFGHCPQAGSGDINRHILSVYAILADGTQWFYNEDVTGQMHDILKNPKRYEIFLDLYDLPVPKPIVNGSGFRPTVDGWMGEEIEVTM